MGLGVSASNYWSWSRRFDCRYFHNFKCGLGLERGPPSIVKIIEYLLDWEVADPTNKSTLIDLTERNDNHIISSYYQLPVICRSLVDRKFPWELEATELLFKMFIVKYKATSYSALLDLCMQGWQHILSTVNNYQLLVNQINSIPLYVKCRLIVGRNTLLKMAPATAEIQLAGFFFLLEILLFLLIAAEERNTPRNTAFLLAKVFGLSHNHYTINMWLFRCTFIYLFTYFRRDS